jgi:hypothetical protein
MNNEFKITAYNKQTTVYAIESASSGGTSSGSVASVSMPMGGVRKRGDNLIAQESDKKKVPAEKPRNFVAKNAKMGGAGAHKKKETDIPRKAKHKKPFMESYDDTEQEVSMAGSELYGAAKHAKQLLALIQQHGSTQGLEAWQQSKITKAADYLNSVLQSLDYDTNNNDQDIPEGAGSQEGRYEFETTILNPNLNIDDENSPEEIDVRVTYDIEGSYQPATWGYHGGEPEEHPELNIMTVTDLDNGQEISDTLEAPVINSLEQKAWEHFEQQEPDFDDSPADDYDESMGVMENANAGNQLPALEKQLSNAEAGLRRAREITRQIKYDSVSMTIVSEITELAKSLGLEAGIKYQVSGVMEAERALEAAVYELEETFEDHVKDIRWKIEDLEDQDKYPQESLQEKMMPASMFAGSKKNKLGTAGQWRNKGSKKNSPAKAGDLVGGCAQESTDPYLNGLSAKLESAVRKG